MSARFRDPGVDVPGMNVPLGPLVVEAPTASTRLEMDLSAAEHAKLVQIAERLARTFKRPMGPVDVVRNFIATAHVATKAKP